MAVTLASDIVMDVLKAADPAELAAARHKLATRAAAAAAPAFDIARPPPPVAEAPPSPRKEALQKFEAVVLQSFIKTMLPEDSASVYGAGLSGDMWKSLMAEKIASTFAERGGIGIADRLLADHYLEGEKTVPLQGVDRSPDRAEAGKKALLSAALVHEIQRAVIGTTRDAEADGLATAMSSRG